MILKAENIVKSFGKKRVLKGLDFEIPSGTLNGIVGENGSGKSTLLKIIVGQWKADKGMISIGGKIGYCPQESLIFPQLTIEEHFKYFSAAYRLGRDSWQKSYRILLEHFNFEQYQNYKVHELSGGTQQKLNLSLALFHEPELLILDEPYNGFDWETYMHFWNFAKQLLHKGCTILVVTHLLNEKDRFDRIYHLKNGLLE